MTQVRCEECKRDFGSEDALRQHNNSKHSAHEGGSRKKLTYGEKNSVRNWLIFIIVFLVLVGGITYLTIKNSSSGTTSGKYSGLSFREVCAKTGGMWMIMGPTQNYIPTDQPACYGCMQRDGDHICEKERYLQTLSA